MSRTPSKSRYVATMRALWQWWATRSLAMGALATLMDLLVGVACVSALATSTRVGAMSGVAVGGVFTFFANRYVAFREKEPALASPALKFALATVLSMLVHGQLVVLLRDRFGVPFVPAKLFSDVAVFTFGQLFLLRVFIFPKQPDKPEREDEEPALSPVPLDRG